MEKEELLEKHSKVLSALECNPQWYDIVDSLCAQVQKYIDNFDYVEQCKISVKGQDKLECYHTSKDSNIDIMVRVAVDLSEEE